MFEWQKHTQDSTEVPPYSELLEFLNMRAQASEVSEHGKRPSKREPLSKKFGSEIASRIGNIDTTTTNCVLCKNDKHPMYVCPKFKILAHPKTLVVLKEHSLCINCLRPGNFAKQCKSKHRCRVCQNPHHTLLHVENAELQPLNVVTSVSSAVASGALCNALLMTCRVQVGAPDGSVIEARALLESASSASFISDRLANTLSLPRSSHKGSISGIAGLTHKTQSHTTTQFTVRSRQPDRKTFEVSAIVVPKVTCDLPIHPVRFDSSWKHLYNIPLADPNFRQPGRIDILLGVEMYVKFLLQGRRTGAPDAPVAFETELGLVLAGSSRTETTTNDYKPCCPPVN